MYKHPNIDGFMSDEELQWLYETAQKYSSIIEIGSFKGRSTHALLSGTKGKVTAIDPFMIDLNPSSPLYKTKLKKEFEDNLKDFKNLEHIEKYEHEVDIEPVEMTFLDFTTDYSIYKQALERWIPKATKIICGDEYTWDSVKKAVDETFGKPDGTVGKIWWKIIN